MKLFDLGKKWMEQEIERERECEKDKVRERERIKEKENLILSVAF